MAVSAALLVICGCVWGFCHVEATLQTLQTLSSLDSSFCHGGLKVKYPELEIDRCLIIPKELRQKISTVWQAPEVYFPQAHKVRAVSTVDHLMNHCVYCAQRLKEMKNGEDKQWLAELSSIAQAALREQRLDISLILIPSRVHRKNKMYVLVMVDPDAPSRSSPSSANWRHWLVMNIQGKELQKGEIKGTTLTSYAPPTPPQKTGFHRYQFRLFEQPADAPVTPTLQVDSYRGKWDLQAFISRFDAGEPVATVQFLTQNYKD